MGGMFESCEELTSLDVSSFDTSSVTSMWEMFGHCPKLTSIDVSGFDTSNVTKMYDMFFACNKLEYLDLSNWDMGKVTEADDYYMLLKCDSLNEINTPRNVIINIGLPATYYRENDIDEKYNELPMNSTNSFKLIKLKDKAVTGISLDSDYKELKVGESFELVAKVEPEDATNRGVTWSSSNPSVVSVDDKGKVLAGTENRISRHTIRRTAL